MADKGEGVTDTGQTIAQGEKKQTVKRAEFGIRLQDSTLLCAKPSECFYFHLFLPDSVVQCGECCISPVHFLEKLSTKSSQGNIARSKQRMKHSIGLLNGTHIADETQTRFSNQLLSYYAVIGFLQNEISGVLHSE